MEERLNKIWMNLVEADLGIHAKLDFRQAYMSLAHSRLAQLANVAAQSEIYSRVILHLNTDLESLSLHNLTTNTTLPPLATSSKLSLMWKSI